MRVVWKQLRCGLQGMVRGFYTVDRVLHPGGTPAGTESQNQVDGHSNRSFGSSPSVIQQPQVINSHVDLTTVATLVAVLGPLYGIVMGSYAWVEGARDLDQQWLQMLYSGIKVPILILVTVGVTLPSFFVFYSLAGLRDNFLVALRAVVSAQAGLVIILVALAPLTLLFYVSNTFEQSYSLAILSNAMMFGLASVSAQRLLAIYYRPLIAKNARHRWMMRLWIFVYAFVGIQAGYILRPFIGNPNSEIDFLRRDSFKNAYVKIWQLISDVLFST